MPSSEISELLIETPTVQHCLKGDLNEGLSCDLGEHEGTVLEWKDIEAQALNPETDDVA